MIILLTLIATVITGVPLAAVVLVTVASRREETVRSIATHAPGRLAHAARKLLGFHSTGISRPAGRGAGPAAGGAACPPTPASWPTRARMTTWS